VDFAVRGVVAATVETVTFDQVNKALSRLRRGEVVGRRVPDFSR
jgi:D-arabinose 1-dehydrogenase-like Zn-dependent alcohol dehydrogenase